MEELDFDLSQISTRQKSRSQRKNQTKFSVSNEKEFLESNIPLKAMRLRQARRRKFRESKAKSEEKYTGGPLYQIFIAKYPELQALSVRFSSTMERHSAKSPSLFMNSPTLKKSPQLRNFEKEEEARNDLEESPKVVRSTPRKGNRRRIEEKPCKIFTVGN